MKHATEATLSSIDDFLEEVRRFDVLNEKKQGVFYWKSRAFLHFHEDPAGVFADLRTQGADFDRLPANTTVQRAAILARIRAAVAS